MDRRGYAEKILFGDYYLFLNLKFIIGERETYIAYIPLKSQRDFVK